MPTTPAGRLGSAWCCGCRVETDHETAIDLAGRPDVLCRRTLVCKECGTVSFSTVEVGEAEYDRLRRRSAPLRPELFQRPVMSGHNPA